MSSAGMPSLLGPEVDGVEVGCVGSEGDAVGYGDTVGWGGVGVFVGCMVGGFVGALVMSNALHFVPP